MKKGGIISKVLIVIAVIILLKYWFHIDVLAWLNTPKIHDFLMKFWVFFMSIWESYLEAPVKSILEFIRGLVNNHS